MSDTCTICGRTQETHRSLVHTFTRMAGDLRPERPPKAPSENGAAIRLAIVLREANVLSESDFRFVLTGQK